MYTEFGSKQGLFEATPEHDNSKYLAPVEIEGAGVYGTRRAFANDAWQALDKAQHWRHIIGCVSCCLMFDPIEPLFVLVELILLDQSALGHKYPVIEVGFEEWLVAD